MKNKKCKQEPPENSVSKTVLKNRDFFSRANFDYFLFSIFFFFSNSGDPGPGFQGDLRGWLHRGPGENIAAGGGID